MLAAFFRPLKPVPLHAQRLQIGVLASDRQGRRPIAFVEIAVSARPCATVPVCLREFRHASKANRRIAGIIRSVTTGTQLLCGFERRTAIMNYGRKRFECGMIHASGIFHVVGNACRFMPKPSNWGGVGE